jgi:hypothetical protein
VATSQEQFGVARERQRTCFGESVLAVDDFRNQGFTRPVLHYRWRAWALNSSSSLVLLVASNERLEKKLLSSLPRYVACCEGCEPHFSRSEVFVRLTCLRCGVFALHSVLPSDVVNVRRNHNINGRCQRYRTEHRARLALALPCWRVLPCRSSRASTRAARPLQVHVLQFSAST